MSVAVSDDQLRVNAEFAFRQSGIAERYDR